MAKQVTTVRGPAHPIGPANTHVAQEINGLWYVFHTSKLDKDTGHYFGAIVAGAPSIESAITRLNGGRG